MNSTDRKVVLSLKHRDKEGLKRTEKLQPDVHGCRVVHFLGSKRYLKEMPMRAA